jgi:hypothetical protein
MGPFSTKDTGTTPWGKVRDTYVQVFMTYPKPPNEILEWALTVPNLQSMPSEYIGAGVYLDRKNPVIAWGISVESIPSGPSRKVDEETASVAAEPRSFKRPQPLLGRHGITPFTERTHERRKKCLLDQRMAVCCPFCEDVRKDLLALAQLIVDFRELRKALLQYTSS